MRASDHIHPILDLGQPTTYRILVQGRLDGRWSDWFGEMAIVVERQIDRPPVTTLTGTVADQAALLGILRALYTLGLPLLSVKCLETSEVPGFRGSSAEGEGKDEG